MKTITDLLTTIESGVNLGPVQNEWHALQAHIQKLQVLAMRLSLGTLTYQEMVDYETEMEDEDTWNY